MLVINNTKKILVLSGKGGVGKTTVSVNLASALAKKKQSVGLLDADIHGPNIPKMLGVEDSTLEMKNDKIIPIKINEYLSMVSMAYLVENKSDAVIWRGPMKHKLLQQFVQDVDWGFPNYLIADFPPGTGDECISAVQLIKDLSGAIIVSTPQQVSLLDVSRSIDFCKKLNIPVIGLVENMSGGIFGEGTVESFAKEQDVPFLGSIPLEANIAQGGDSGSPFILAETVTPANASFDIIVDKVIAFKK